jgi:signal transduction histidine kinase
LPAESEPSRSLDTIEKNVEYINKIMVNLQDYARPLKPFTRETNLKETFESLFSRIVALKSTKISFCAEKDAKRVITDPDLLNRILGNLVMNSIQAMPAGKLNVHAYRDENDYVITVKDTGVGIS